jgi:hypothetical protein
MNFVLPIVGKTNKQFWAGFSYFFVQLIYIPISLAVFSREDARWVGADLIFLGAPIVALVLAILSKTRSFGLGMVTACVFNWALLFAFVIFTLVFPKTYS